MGFRIQTMFSSILLLFFASIISPTSLVFADECPAGTRPAATAADVAAMTEAGIPNAAIGMCWDASSASVGQSVSDAKKQLETMWCGGRAPVCGPFVGSMDQLDPKFAVCAAKFLSRIRAQDSSICIASAFRSADHQQLVCAGRCGPKPAKCAPPGQSNHQKGLALDIEKPGMKTIPAWVHQMAQQGSGISFPVTNDDGHMEPAGGDCSTPGYVAPGNTGSMGPMAGRSPFMTAMQGLQNFFTPPQPQQCQQGYILLNGSCLPPQAQSALQTNSPLNTISNPASGSSGTTGTTNSTNTNGNTNSNTNSSSNGASSVGGPGINISGLLDGSDATTKTGTSTSAIDLINALAGNDGSTGGSATGTEIGKSVALNDSLKNGVPLSAQGQNAVALSPTSTYTLNPMASQTFVSQDLSQTPIAPYAAGNASTFSLLESLRQTLVTILQYLRPFGGNVPHVGAVAVL